MRLLKFLLIFPLIAYAGVKGYIWYKVKTVADSAIAQVVPFADVSYESIFSSLDGAVGVEGLVIRPKMTTDEFTIQKLGFSAGSLPELFNLGQQIKEKKIPTHLSLEMEKVSLDLNSELFSMLRQMQAQGSLQRKPTVMERMDAIACGNIEDFGIKELTDMGYSEMLLDIKMNLDYDEALNRMSSATQIKDSDLYSANIQTAFRFSIPEIIAAGRRYEPDISTLSLEYKDSGYYKLRNQYCAKQRGGSIEEYIDANITGLSQGIGAKFPDETVENYRQFMTKGGSLKVSLKPTAGTSFSQLQFYKPNQVVDILGVELAINDVNVDLNQISWIDNDKDSPAKINTAQKQKREQKRTQALKPDSKQAKIEKTPAPAVEPMVKEPQFQTVRASKLARHIGKRIQVVTAAGKQHDGVLEKVDKERIRIQIRLGSGQYSFPVKLKEIKQAQVFM